jgi:DNA-binding NtrC family response regulator
MSDARGARPSILLNSSIGDDGARTLGRVARVVTASSRAELLRLLPDSEWRALVVDIEGPADLPFLSRLAERAPAAVLVALHPKPTVAATLEAEEAGAAFFLDPGEIPLLPERLRPYLIEGPDHPVGSEAASEEQVIGTAPALVEAYRVVARVAASSVPVLVEGESGTGKELIARALHSRSLRARGSFVPVNCAALPEGLLEAELFGHERGAFTGAVGRSDGRFGRAHGGTLFLDEIGEMGLGLQAKLLRALETGEIERLGSRESIRVDVRVVSATHRDLEERVRAGAFREDLFYRLAVVRVALPPLRARRDDVVPLVESFVALLSARYQRPIRALSTEALASLRSRSWPGNVRELRNVLDRAVLLARGGVIRSIDVDPGSAPPTVSPIDSVSPDGYPPTFPLRRVEEFHIRKVLAYTGGRLGEAAELLGVHRNTMTAKIREYGIDPRGGVARADALP